MTVFRPRQFRVRRVVGMLTGAAALAVLAAGCTPVIEHRGYVPNDEEIGQISPGVPRALVEGRLGSPSLRSTFDNNVWFYMASTERTYLFFDREVIDRRIIAIEFDEEDRVAEVREYGLQDGRVVPYASRETPTRGKELTFLQQMFGNVGRLPLPGQQGAPGGRRN